MRATIYMRHVYVSDFASYITMFVNLFSPATEGLIHIKMFATFVRRHSCFLLQISELFQVISTRVADNKGDKMKVVGLLFLKSTYPFNMFSERARELKKPLA